MFRIALKSLLAQKRRLIGTSLSVILGIAFLAGTMVLGDTVRATFDDLFTNVNKGTDVVVRSSQAIDNQGFKQRAPIEASVLGEVRDVKGVAQAEPDVTGYGVLLDKNGDQVTPNGPPPTAGNWIGDSSVNPYQLAEGRAPKAPDEAVIDRDLATKAKLDIGDTTTVQLPDPYKVTIVGIATFGGEGSAGGQTFVGLQTPTAQQQILKNPNQYSTVRVKAEAGVSQEELKASIEAALPDGNEAITGAALTKEQKDAINSGFLDLLTNFLIVFACVALVVAIFSIYNTFTIIMAQRTQESALLRALGASRRQVLQAALFETFLIGLFGAVVGLVLGLGVAKLLAGLFKLFGADLPIGSLVVTPSTIAIGLIVGLFVTMVAGVFPAVRTSRVPPLAALRDISVDHSGRSRTRLVIGVVLTLAALGLVFAGAFGHSQITAGLGAALLIFGIVILGPVVARPASSILGLPASKVRGISGLLARENAMRNPRRTSSTASALLVGVAVVTLFSVFGASINASVSDSVDKAFAGDLVITTGNFGGGPGSGFSPEVATKLAEVPQVQNAAGIGLGIAKANNFDVVVTTVDPSQLAGVLDLDVVEGDFAKMSDEQIAISKTAVKDTGFKVGQPVDLTLPDGTVAKVSVGAVYDDKRIVQSDWLVPSGLYNPHAPQALDLQALVKLKPGVPLAEGQAAVTKVAKQFPGTKVQNKEEFRKSIAQGVTTFLIFVYALLLLAVVIALFGIANTLSLSVFERTREIGLLRAVGGYRRQIRSMVRWESVIVALFGTVGGIGIGLFLAWALFQASSGSDEATVFNPGIPFLVAILFVGAFVGVLAAIRPARRAAKLDVLQAISQ